jgi:cobalt-zinc-cadmium efflux system membrane fusion protein
VKQKTLCTDSQFDDFKNKKIVTKNAYTLLMKLKNTEEEE